MHKKQTINHNQIEETRLEQSWFCTGRVFSFLLTLHTANHKRLEQPEYQSSRSHTRAEPKQLPLPGSDLTHTHAPTDTEHFNYCNAIGTWHPPLHACFQGHPPLPTACQAALKQSKRSNFWEASHLCCFAKVNSQRCLFSVNYIQAGF